MKKLFFLFVFIVLISFTILAVITGKAILISWEANHSNQIFLGTCVIYILSIVAVLSAMIWVIYSSILESKFEKELKALQVQQVPQFAL